MPCREEEGKQESTPSELTTATPSEVSEHTQQTIDGEETNEEKKEEDSTLPGLATTTPPEVKEFPQQPIGHEDISKVHLTGDDDNALMNDAPVPPPHQPIRSLNLNEHKYFNLKRDDEQIDGMALREMFILLQDKLKMEIPFWNTYSTINALVSTDGSIYIPGSYSNTVKQHVATLMG
ncbi:unnamed protein product [Trichobilharzia regenti]|nr:unnamed protein product [Trichobilharzia regenti]